LGVWREGERRACKKGRKKWKYLRALGGEDFEGFNFVPNTKSLNLGN